MQLLDSDWPANVLAGSHFRAQETRALSPGEPGWARDYDSVCIDLLFIINNLQ